MIEKKLLVFLVTSSFTLMLGISLVPGALAQHEIYEDGVDVEVTRAQKTIIGCGGPGSLNSKEQAELRDLGGLPGVGERLHEKIKQLLDEKRLFLVRERGSYISVELWFDLGKCELYDGSKGLFLLWGGSARRKVWGLFDDTLTYGPQERYPSSQKVSFASIRELINSFSRFFTSQVLDGIQPEFSAQRRPRVAILDFTDTTSLWSERKYGSAIASMLTTRLKEDSQFIIMERRGYQEALRSWRDGKDVEEARANLRDLDAILIGDVTLLEDGSLQVDARLMGLDGRLMASSSEGGPASHLRMISEELASKLQVAFLRPYTGRVTVVVEGPDLVEVELFPILTERHLPEEYPPLKATSAVSPSKGLLDANSRLSSSDVWRTNSGVLELENLLKGWYSVRVTRPGFGHLGNDGRRWEAVPKDSGGKCGFFRIVADSEARGENLSGSDGDDLEEGSCFFEAQGSYFVYVDDRDQPPLIRFRGMKQVEGYFKLHAPHHLRGCLEYSISSLSLDLDEPAQNLYDSLGCERHGLERLSENRDLEAREPYQPGFLSKSDTIDLLRRNACEQIRASATSYNYVNKFGEGNIDKKPFPAGYYRLTFSHLDFEDATVFGKISRLSGQRRSTTNLVIQDVGLGLWQGEAAHQEHETALWQRVNMLRKLHGPIALEYLPLTPSSLRLRRGPSDAWKKESSGDNELLINTDGRQQQRDNMIRVDADPERVVLHLASDVYALRSSADGLERWVKYLNLQSDCLPSDTDEDSEDKPDSDMGSGDEEEKWWVRFEDLEQEPECEALKTGFWTAGFPLQSDEHGQHHLPDNCLPGLFDTREALEDIPDERFTTLRRRLRDVDLLVLDPSAISRIEKSSRLSEVVGEYLVRGHAILAFVSKEDLTLALGTDKAIQELAVKPRLTLRGKRKLDFRPGPLWGAVEGLEERYKFRFPDSRQERKYRRRTLRSSPDDVWQVISKSRKCWACPKKPRILETHWPEGEIPGYIMVWGDDVPRLAKILDVAKNNDATFSDMRQAFEQRAVCEAKRLMYQRLGDSEWDEESCQLVESQNSP